MASLQLALDAIHSVNEQSSDEDKARMLAAAATNKAEADNKELTEEAKVDTASSANEEISKDAADLVNDLGIMHETDAGNAQQAYADASKSSIQSANN